MFLTELLSKSPKLRTAKKLTARARKCTGTEAEQLFEQAYQAYGEVIQGYPLLVDALYHWGFALYHHAQKYRGARAEALYRDASAKFEFCLLANPSHLGAAIDWGATLMAWARERRATPNDALYEQARQQFERANAIQKASASYNLACLHALRGEFDACRAMLEQARNHGSLPDLDVMLEDDDLAMARRQAWFEAFLQSLTPLAAASVPDNRTGPEEATQSSGDNALAASYDTLPTSTTSYVVYTTTTDTGGMSGDNATTQTAD